MGDLATRIEITKLAHAIGVPEDELTFLASSTPGDVRDLRDLASAAIFRRNESRVKRLAAGSRTFPAAVSAKIAQMALGPLLSARVAAALDPKDAAKLAKQLDVDFLAELAASLDPDRAAPILQQLPDDLLLSVGRKILAAGDHPTLGRFFSVVPTEVAVQIATSGSPRDVLQVALFADDPSALDAVVRALSDEVLGQIVVASTDGGLYDAAVSLLLTLSQDSADRIVAQVGAVEDGALDGLVAAIDEHDVWSAVVPALRTLDQAQLGRLVNVPITLRQRVIDRFVGTAHDLGQADTIAATLAVLDADHLETIKGSEVAGNRALQDWVIESAGAGEEFEALLRRHGLR